MDLAALKNLDIKDLLNKIKGAGAGNILQDKKILIKFQKILLKLKLFYKINPKVQQMLFCVQKIYYQKIKMF